MVPEAGAVLIKIVAAVFSSEVPGAIRCWTTGCAGGRGQVVAPSQDICVGRHEDWLEGQDRTMSSAAMHHNELSCST